MGGIQVSNALYKTSRDLLSLITMCMVTTTVLLMCIGKFIVNEPYKKKHLLSDHLLT